MRYTRKPADQALRERLTEITTSAEDVDLHPARIEALRSEFSHSIRPLQLVDLANFKATHFNCHAFAFRLTDWPEFSGLVNHHEVWPDGWFVSDLLPSLDERDAADVRDDDVVVYTSDAGTVLHSGVVRGALIHSKWGGQGHLWEHGTFEMPLSCGVIDRYFAAPPFDVAVAGFVHRADQQRRRQIRRAERR